MKIMEAASFFLHGLKKYFALFLFLANVNYQSIDDSTQLPFLSIFLIPIEVLDFHSAYVPKELNHIFCKL